MAEAQKVPAQATTGGDTSKSLASLTHVPNEITSNDITKLPEIPDNFDSDSKNTTISSNSKNLKKEALKAFEVSNTKIESNTAQNSKIPAVPEVPSVPLESVAGNSSINELSQTTEDNSSGSITGNLSNLSKFVIDEAKVLLLPNDDIVQGELTDSALYEQMDFMSYSKLFESQQIRAANSIKRKVIDNFLKNYDANFNKVKILTDAEAASQAYSAVSRNSLFALRTLTR